LSGRNIAQKYAKTQSKKNGIFLHTLFFNVYENFLTIEKSKMARAAKDPRNFSYSFRYALTPYRLASLSRF
jgi:hypothetical protein